MIKEGDKMYSKYRLVLRFEVQGGKGQDFQEVRKSKVFIGVVYVVAGFYLVLVFEGVRGGVFEGEGFLGGFY